MKEPTELSDMEKKRVQSSHHLLTELDTLTKLGKAIMNHTEQSQNIDFTKNLSMKVLKLI